MGRQVRGVPITQHKQTCDQEDEDLYRDLLNGLSNLKQIGRGQGRRGGSDLPRTLNFPLRSDCVKGSGWQTTPPASPPPNLLSATFVCFCVSSSTRLIVFRD